MVSSRLDGYMDSWNIVLGISYRDIKKARYKSLESREPYLTGISDESSRFVALDLIGESQYSYCRNCGRTYPKSELIHPSRRANPNQTVRVCEQCAEREKMFSERAIAEALDSRAIRNGKGQRRLYGSYEG